ncbi:TonB-dependent receptor [Marinimicrobium alkaliphilum]|uniref:TonB-dependent receptor n=1 Tax=Marinimicrobium alkaliphilum TaxID=2202654 RepID=UPI000DBABBF0|nr:TonB-dependent receptor [Marinimicrobium alkaliphilum]
MDKKYVLTALGYALLGMLLGIYMAKTANNIQHVTHAHILLIGFVVSFIYGVIYKLWLKGSFGRMGQVQYWAHQAGTLIIVVGLFLLYGGFVAESVVGPILGIGSVAVIVAMLLMKVMFIRSIRAS